MARAGIPMRAASANRSSTRAAPSSIEYSVCTWRCAKLPGMTAVALLPLLLDCPGPEFPTACGQNDTGVIPGRSLHPAGPRGNDPRVSEIVAAQRFRREPPVQELVAGGSSAAAPT